MSGMNYLFNNVPLYTKELFKIFPFIDNMFYEINAEELKRFFKYIGLYEKRLISYCHCCKKEFPFEKRWELYNFNGNKVWGLVFSDEKSKSEDSEINLYYKTNYGMSKGLIDSLKNGKIWYMSYYFKCTNNEQHEYRLYISIELKNEYLIVRKIGQNPSMLTIKGFDFDKYKKILEKINGYDDYKKADLSNAEHFYVGAYAYLRRIFEKLILYYLGDTKLKDNHMDTKIEAVKDKFDPRVQNLLKNLYGILSKSIHEFDEDESKEYYEYLKAVIEIQLEYMFTENEKDKQSKKLEGILNRIATETNK